MSAEPLAVRQFTVEVDDDDIRLDRWFKRHLPDIPFGTISRWARTGQIRVDGRRAGPGDRIAAGQLLRVPPDDAEGERTTRDRPEMSADEIEFARSLVILRTPAALVLNKPPGLATQGGTGTHRHVDGLLDALADDGPRPRLVHRLDKDTSGVLLIARTPGAAAKYSRAFSGRTARKIYWALVVGVPDIEDGLIDLPLAKQPGSGGEKMHVDEANGASARTRYRVVERAGNRAAWVVLQPLTGRTHQLRAHLAAIGHPIVGDGKYGGPEAFLTGGVSRKMHLHARHLRVPSPEGMVEATAEPPEHFSESLALLGFRPLAGDVPLHDDSGPPSREEKKARARTHAKQVRKERRGERSGRRGATGGRGAERGATGTTGKTPEGDAPGRSPGRPAGSRPSGPGRAAGPGRPAGAGRPAGSGRPAGGKRPPPRPRTR